MNLSPSPTPAPEETLRLIARLPAPEGLEDRVRERLATAPRTPRVLAWPPSRAWMHAKLVRGAAAAAIVCVVTGGGWAVYTRVAPPPAAKAAATPSPAVPGGFSSANAMRTPKTLEGPTLHPEAAKPLVREDQRRPARRHGHRKNLNATQPRTPASAP